MEDTDEITIISKEGEKITFDKRISGFCDGLQVYDLDEEIDLSQQASSLFLKTMKTFYEENEFNAEKLKVVERIQGNKLEDNLISKVNVDLMKPLHDKAIKNKNLQELLECQKGAELLRAVEFLNLVAVTIATVVYCPESEAEQKEYALKWELDDKNAEEVLEQLEKEGEKELLDAWEDLNQNLCSQFMTKLDELLGPNVANANANAQNDQDMGDMFG